MKLPVLLVPFLFLAIAADAPVPQTSPAPAAQTQPAKPPLTDTKDPVALHSAILEMVDTGRASDAVTLLDRLKTVDPNRYASLPYALLEARMLTVSQNLTAASSVYEGLAADSRLSKFALLPLARMAVVQGRAKDAVRYYQRYLSNLKAADYALVAREALDYCVLQQLPEDVRNTASIVERNQALNRLAAFYRARSFLLEKQTERGRLMLRDLIRGGRKDDAASLALSVLDTLEGNQLSDQEKISRGRLAYDVWNFSLAVSYLQPGAASSMDNAYFYARALAYSGKLSEARKAFEDALAQWPNDRMSDLARYQFALLCLRTGDNRTAEQLLTWLRSHQGGQAENATFKLIDSLRAQSRLDEAIRLVGPYASARTPSTRQRALFLRGRINFQAGRYREALTDFSQLSKDSTSRRFVLNREEVMFWKAVVLRKLGNAQDAIPIFRALSLNPDFYGQQAGEKLKEMGVSRQPASYAESVAFPKLPDISKEQDVTESWQSGDLLGAFLYLHLYDEAAQELSSVSVANWRLLGVDPDDRWQKYLAIAYIAGLGRNYSTANYYAEVFLDHHRSVSFAGDVLKVLFPFPYNEAIRKYAQERKVDPFLVLSIMRQESKFKPTAKSPAFARGLMQLIPSTAAQLAHTLGLQNFSEDQLYNPDININLGTKYVQDMVQKFGNRPEILAASYNSGESNVRRWLACTSSNELIEFLSNIDYPETKNYVMIVLSNYDWYTRVYGKS